MGANSHIEWTDHTFNPWIGCTKVSPGCAHCYAATLDSNRYSKTMDGGTKANPVSHWGPGAPRHRTSTWGEPVKWNKFAASIHCVACAAEFAGCTWEGLAENTTCPKCGADGKLIGKRPRVFCASLADWLDEEAPLELFADLLDLVALTPNLDWLLLTKRPQNWRSRLEAIERGIFQCGTRHFAGDWLGGEAPANIWLGTTVEDQQRADERIPVLLSIPARVRFLSCEPLLGPVRLDRCAPHILDGDASNPGVVNAFNGISHHPLTVKVSVSIKGSADGVQWVICGGESGTGSRPMRADWAQSLRNQCDTAGVAFFFKQWGEHLPLDQCKAAGVTFPVLDAMNYAQTGVIPRVGKKKAGRLLDGREHNELPALLAYERRA